MDVLFVVVGLALVVITLSDVFLSVIVPRPAGRMLRPSASLARWGWRFFRWLALRAPDTETSENVLATWPPLALVLFLAFWVSAMILGYGLIFYGLRAQLHPAPDFAGAVYFAGSSLLTIGYGDIAPIAPLTRLVALITAASGLGTVAIVTTFLFSIFGAYQRREAFIVAASEFTGSPPSGLTILERHARFGFGDNTSALFTQARGWMADVMETHLSYPILTYFRSNHDDQSWVGMLGALLDASSLMLSTVDKPHHGDAMLLSGAGRHLTHDLAHYFELRTQPQLGVERSEFDEAYARLGALGFPLVARDAAWASFVELRSAYAPSLNAMARWYRIPPAQWIGDRSPIHSRHAGIAAIAQIIEREPAG